MLPQFLVQNKIISQPGKDDFQLYWPSVVPILNTNYFYVDKLVDESQHYHDFLRPWKEISPLSQSDPTTDALKIHQYYSATVSNPSYSVNIGDWVGRVRNTQPTHALDDCLVLTRSEQYYIYDDITKQFVLNTAAGIPCIIRSSVWGLNEIKSVFLRDINKVDNMWQYICHSADIQFRGGAEHNPSPINLAFTTDAIMGRIIWNDSLIAHVPVTIARKWNAQIMDYEFALQFPDSNFPPDAKVEFW